MSIHSMTGFGQSEGELGGIGIVVEAKSVNSRFLDLSVKLPGIYSRFEHPLTKLLQSKLIRGRVEVSVFRRRTSTPTPTIKFDVEVLNSVALQVEQLVASSPALEPLKLVVLSEVVRRREVLDFVAEDALLAGEEELLFGLVDRALSALVSSRCQEGTNLQLDLKEHLKRLGVVLSSIEGFSGELAQQINKRLSDKLTTVLQGIEIDQTRLLQEVAYLVDRADIAEEVSRLRSHFQLFDSYISGVAPSEREAVGKRLDFVVQELLREFNTVGSKAQDKRISHLVVEAKTSIERLKEQVQNIE